MDYEQRVRGWFDSNPRPSSIPEPHPLMNHKAKKLRQRKARNRSAQRKWLFSMRWHVYPMIAGEMERRLSEVDFAKELDNFAEVHTIPHGEKKAFTSTTAYPRGLREDCGILEDQDFGISSYWDFSNGSRLVSISPLGDSIRGANSKEMYFEEPL